MKNRILKSFICFLALFTLLFSSIPVSAKSSSIKNTENIIDSIVSFKVNESGVSTVQQWINTDLTKNAGATAEWYVLALSQNGSYDFSSYESALLKYLKNNEIYSAASRQKYALSLIAVGSTDKYIQTTLNNSIGEQGIMSWIFGLHLLNNGYKSDNYSASAVKSKILSLQHSDGGWSVTGTDSDVDVTAMAVQSLSPYYNSDSDVKKSIEKALSLLSERQLSDGDYSSYGVSNPESTSQVITALSSLDIDCQNDSRFIKNGNTLFDGLLKYQLSNGSFCHKLSGGYNNTSTVQALYSLVSYLRMSNGKTAFYILDARNPSVFSVSQSESANKNEPQDNESSQSDDNNSNDKSDAKFGNNGAVNNNGDSNTQSEKSPNGKTNSVNSVEDNSKYTKKNLKDSADSKAAVASNDNTSETQNVIASKSVDNPTESDGYKLWVILIIIIISIITCIVLRVLKKLNKKNLIVILIVAILAVSFVWLNNFQTVEEHYNTENISKKNSAGTVTISINCDTISENKEFEYIPSDGVILQTAEYKIQDGDTVYDILSEATAKEKIHLECNKTTENTESVYVEGINHIYEFDFGELSGWMYFVNGEAPSVSCGEYKLTDGDIIEWKYTCNLGEDLK